MRLLGLHALVLLHGDPLGGGAEDGDLGGVHQVPHDVGMRVQRGAVVQDQGGAQRQGAHHPVPHHPAHGGVVEQDVPGRTVALDLVLFQMLHQGAAGSVDDALGLPGRSTRIHDEQGVIEGQLPVLDLVPLRIARAQFQERAHEHLFALQTNLRFRMAKRNDDHVDQTVLQAVSDRPEFAQVVVDLGVVPDGFDGEDQLRLNLLESVQDAGHAEIRRRGTPYGSQRGGGSHDLDSLGAVGQITGHSVTHRDAQVTKRRRNVRPRFVLVRQRYACQSPSGGCVRW